MSSNTDWMNAAVCNSALGVLEYLDICAKDLRSSIQHSLEVPTKPRAVFFLPKSVTKCAENDSVPVTLDCGLIDMVQPDLDVNLKCLVCSASTPPSLRLSGATPWTARAGYMLCKDCKCIPEREVW